MRRNYSNEIYLRENKRLQIFLDYFYSYLRELSNNKLMMFGYTIGGRRD